MNIFYYVLKLSKNFFPKIFTKFYHGPRCCRSFISVKEVVMVSVV